jgi:catechol 2,3-dioxygenase-like lactoylglutathione lyase family enzyme
MSGSRLTSIALQTHHIDEMKAFYDDAFGGEFGEIEVAGLTCWFGQVAGITLKLVPLRPQPDPEGYPLHQLGFEVDDVETAISAAIRYGGRQDGVTSQQGGLAYAVVRDPDGNTIELHQRG